MSDYEYDVHQRACIEEAGRIITEGEKKLQQKEKLYTTAAGMEIGGGVAITASTFDIEIESAGYPMQGIPTYEAGVQDNPNGLAIVLGGVAMGLGVGIAIWNRWRNS